MQGLNIEGMELQHPSCQECLQEWAEGQRGLTLMSEAIWYQERFLPLYDLSLRDLHGIVGFQDS